MRKYFRHFGTNTFINTLRNVKEIKFGNIWQWHDVSIVIEARSPIFRRVIINTYVYHARSRADLQHSYGTMLDPQLCRITGSWLPFMKY